eukprot:Gb_01298 [translate_table: standard]
MSLSTPSAIAKYKWPNGLLEGGRKVRSIFGQAGQYGPHPITRHSINSARTGEGRAEEGATGRVSRRGRTWPICPCLAVPTNMFNDHGNGELPSKADMNINHSFYILCFIRLNLSPNGRCTNGRTRPDIIGQELGLTTFAPPYLAPSTNGAVLTKRESTLHAAVEEFLQKLVEILAWRMSSMASGAEKEEDIAGKQVMSERLSGKVVMKRPKKKNKKAKKDIESYMVYICRVLKQVHSDIGISSKAMGIMNSFVNDIFEKIVYEASKLARYSQRHTISSRENQTSVTLVLPGELAKHAVSEGTKAITKFSGV